MPHQRHDSPLGVEPGSPKVGFAGVTGVSRPMENDEHWTLYYFEAHAALCEMCHNPLRVSREGKQLCHIGYELAIDVADILVYRRKDDKVYSRVRDGEREVRVEIPCNYEQTLSLLKAINRAIREGEKFPTRPRSMDKNYLVEPRLSPEQTEAPRLSMRRPYDTKLVEPKSSRPRDKLRRRERESSENLIPDSNRGSLYNDDMRRLERAEKREQDVRYNVRTCEPKLKHSRRPILYP
ncbi:uncharacterized protein PV09_04580 [Verruconis gallopava]|uniref:Uncharacterized protein n=1 Tax=Verruconis gallopava TaxID=253628 RepID=A0A0D2ABS3_9PEZI|nr:uncharacterized protein PV09_04580 [Verruconis gallopava]KIW04283.1 hypothetical protein PV09_04580 [Verruconis gallopava]